MKLDNIINAALRKESFNIPKGMVITGSVNTRINGQIAGTINGNVFAKSKIVVQKGAVLNGDVSAEELQVYGSINGDVQCSGKTIVYNGAVIKGSIHTAEIHIEKDAVVEGMISKAIKEEPAPVAEQTTSSTSLQKEAVEENRSQDTLPPKEETKRQAWF
jgi:cytoskeletal protein CcmA (bactofilin family)